MQGKNTWLFGAGQWGQKYIDAYGNSACKGFIDNSLNKQGTKIRNVEVYSYEEFKKQFNKETDAICITVHSGRDAIFLQLFADKLHIFAKAYIPERGIVRVEDSWDKTINSQLGEEVGLRHYFSCNGFLNGYKGFYLDIGAYHPFIYNNTRWAYELGWRGMNIDPNEQGIKLFNAFRPEDINLNCGVSDENGELMYYTYGAEGKNSFVADRETVLAATRSRSVKVRNINDILDEYHIEYIDFVDIDVEGFDEKIVNTFNWKKYRPRCVLIELLGQGSVEDVLNTEIHQRMKKEGYFLKSFYTVTALYIRNNEN